MFFKKSILTPFSNKLNQNIKLFSDGKTSHLSDIFSVFSENNKIAKLKASRFLLKIIEEKSFNGFLRIAEYMHGSYYMYYENAGWFKIGIKDLFTTEMSPDERKAVLVFASFHSNGFLREKAMEELVHYPNTLKYILIRRNDWVNEVRNSAKKVLVEKYKNLVAGELLSAIPAIEKLIKCKRDNYKEEYDYFISRFNCADNELRNGLNSKEQYVRLFCAELLLKQNYKKEDLKSYLMEERMPYIRENIYSKYISYSNVIETDIVEMMLIDNNARIRIMGMNYFHINKLHKNNFPIEFLLDRNAGIRNFARYIIAQNGSFLFRDFYIEKLKDNNLRAIAGLGETGKKEDCILLERYLDEQDTGIVRVTINALIKLDKEKYLQTFIPYLNDKRVGIVKDVAKFLNKESEIYEDEIRKVFKKSKKEFTRIKCAKLLFSVSKWNSLNNMILALDDKDMAIRDLAMLSIEYWIEKFNRSFITISDTQRKILIENIQKIKRKDIDIKRLLYYTNY